MLFYTTTTWPEVGNPYKTDGDACQKIQIKSLRETNVGVAPLKLKLIPKGDHMKTDTTQFFVNFFKHSPKRYQNG